MSVLDNITSFVDGRVRLRYPALRDNAIAALVSETVSGIEGIDSVQANSVTGSLLIFYNPKKLSREQLLELAEQGADFLPQTKACSCPSRKKPVLNRTVNRLLLASLAASLIGIAAGRPNLHSTAGGLFAALCLGHIISHKKGL